MGFLAQLVTRLFGKTPWFFRVVRWTLFAVAVITGLPELLTNAGIVLPEAVQIFATKTVSIAALVGAFVAQLSQVEPVTHPTDIAEKITQENKKEKEGVI